MAKQILNNQESANTFRNKLNANFTDLYDNKAQKNHSSGTNEYGSATPSLFGHVKITVANGLNVNDGVLSLGAASVSAPGAVQLVNDASTDDATKAVTAAVAKNLKDTAVVTYRGTTVPLDSLGKDGDLYYKTL